MAEPRRQTLAAFPHRFRLPGACASMPGAPLPEDVRKVAVAVECFHKASLIHDDIEDDDAQRYGEKTLHEEHGVAVALNVGDLLIGEGYRLLATCAARAEQKAAMLRIAAEGQRELCRGQGAELCWARHPAPLSSLEVLDIFRKKTAPAFGVALQIGAVYAGVGSSRGSRRSARGLQRSARHRLPDPRRSERSRGKRRNQRHRRPSSEPSARNRL